MKRTNKPKMCVWVGTEGKTFQWGSGEVIGTIEVTKIDTKNKVVTFGVIKLKK